MCKYDFHNQRPSDVETIVHNVVGAVHHRTRLTSRSGDGNLGRVQTLTKFQTWQRWCRCSRGRVMDLANLKLSGWLIGIALVAMFIGMLFSDGSSETRRIEETHRVWQKSTSGVHYYKECIEGHMWLVTKSTHGFEQLAGPIGECT